MMFPAGYDYWSDRSSKPRRGISSEALVMAGRTVNHSTQAFLQLQAMVELGLQAEPPPRPRTEAEEDHIALEDQILMNEGPEALENYQQRKAMSTFSTDQVDKVEETEDDRRLIEEALSGHPEELDEGDWPQEPDDDRDRPEDDVL